MFITSLSSDVSCDVHIKLEAVSPIHCTLQAMLDGRVLVENHAKLPSKTLLNGVPVSERTFMPHNSLLTIGDRKFKFLYPENSSWIIKPMVSYLYSFCTLIYKLALFKWLIFVF